MGGIRSGRRANLALHRQVAHLSECGLTGAAIAHQVGISKQYVSHILKSDGTRELCCDDCAAVVAARPPSEKGVVVLCRSCLERRQHVSFALMLRSLRLAAGISQHELAREVGATQSAISHYELGRVEPRWGLGLELLRALGADASLRLPSSGVARTPQPQH